MITPLFLVIFLLFPFRNSEMSIRTVSSALVLPFLFLCVSLGLVGCYLSSTFECCSLVLSSSSCGIAVNSLFLVASGSSASEAYFAMYVAVVVFPFRPLSSTCIN